MASLHIGRGAEDVLEASTRESENDNEEFYSPTWRNSCDDDSNRDSQQYEDDGVVVCGTSVVDGSIRSLGPIIEEIEVKSSWRVAHMNAHTALSWRWRTLSTTHTIHNDDNHLPIDDTMETKKYADSETCQSDCETCRCELTNRPSISEEEAKDMLLQQTPEVSGLKLPRDEKSRTSCPEASAPITSSSTSAASVVDERQIAHDLAAEALMLMADALNSTPDGPSIEEGSPNSPVRAPTEPSQEERDSWSSLSRNEQDFLNDGVELERLISEHKVDEADWTGLTALQRASMRGHGAYVELLLGLGANPNLTGDTGAASDSLRAPVPPVALALQAGHVEIAEALFEHGATLDWYDKNGGQGGPNSSGFQWWGRRKR